MAQEEETNSKCKQATRGAKEGKSIGSDSKKKAVKVAVQKDILVEEYKRRRNRKRRGRNRRRGG